MNNFKVREIIKFSFYKSIQNKWFIIFNVLTLVSIIVVLNWGNIKNIFNLDQPESMKIAILDENNLIYDDVLQELSEEFEVSRIDKNEYTAENILDDLVIIEVNKDSEQLFEASIISKEGIAGIQYEKIEEALHTARNTLFEEEYDVSDDRLELFQSDLKINRIMLSVDASDSSQKSLINLFSSTITYMVAILIFSKIANEISQEKQSKSSEYILTAVSEKEYLFAKIAGNVIILIFQGLLMLAYYYMAMVIANLSRLGVSELNSISDILVTPINIQTVYYIVALIVYNILNIVLLCIFQAALSAKTSSSSEAGNTVSLLTFSMIVCYIASVEFITPYSKIGLFFAIISCLPILSAYFIPALIVVGQITTWQIVLSLILILISIPIAFKKCSKIFKNGILDYTKMKKKKAKDEELLAKREMKTFGFVIGASIIIYFGVQIVFSLIGTFLLPALFKNIFTLEDIPMILQILLQVVSLGLAYVFVSSYTRKEVNALRKNIDNRSKVKIIFIALLLIFVIQVLFSLVIYPALGIDYDIADTFKTNEESSIVSKIILVIALAIIPAIFEELFFRKAIIDFASKYSKVVALVFSALLFGIIHMNISQALFAFIAGLIFGGIYLYTGDIRLTMLIHFINNGVGVLEMILPGNGFVISSIILIAICVVGLIFLITSIVKKENRNKISEAIKLGINKQELMKYRYIFADYTFDISMILIFLVSIFTENVLR